MGSGVPFSWGLSSHDVGDFFKRVLDHLNDGVYFTDRERHITYWNKGAEALTGYTAEDVLGRCCADGILRHVDHSGELLCLGKCPLNHTMADGRPRQASIFLHHKNGHRVPVEVRACPIFGPNGEIIGAVEIFSDNSRQHAAQERAQDLAKLAFLDPVSQVANRRYLDQKLAERLDQFANLGTCFGILLADVDDFKQVNDTYGHPAGDAVLVAVARTISGGLRGSDIVGRWGGDEFLAILTGVSEHVLAEACERCSALAAQSTVPVNGASIQVTLSIGGAMVAAGDGIESLVKRADERMYHGKHSRRNRASE